MRTPSPLILALVAPACLNADSGTIVGNPGQMRVAVAPGDAVDVQSARLSVRSATFTACDGDQVDVAIQGSLDLADPVLLQAPGGTWCGMRISPDGPLLVEGSGPGGGVLLADLDLPEVDFQANQLPVDGGYLVLELAGPGWLSAPDLGLVGGNDVSIGPDDPLAAGLVDAILTLSRAFPDDGDGLVDSDERARGGSGDDDDQDSEDGGGDENQDGEDGDSQ